MFNAKPLTHAGFTKDGLAIYHQKPNEQDELLKKCASNQGVHLDVIALAEDSTFMALISPHYSAFFRHLATSAKRNVEFSKKALKEVE